MGTVVVYCVRLRPALLRGAVFVAVGPVMAGAHLDDLAIFQVRRCGDMQQRHTWVNAYLKPAPIKSYSLCVNGIFLLTLQV